MAIVRNLMECPKCGYGMQADRYLEEEEVQTYRGGPYHKTGRVRRAVNCLICDCCGHKECVDDSLDGPWFTPSQPIRR